MRRESNWIDRERCLCVGQVSYQAIKPARGKKNKWKTKEIRENGRSFSKKEQSGNA